MFHFSAPSYPFDLETLEVSHRSDPFVRDEDYTGKLSMPVNDNVSYEFCFPKSMEK